MTIKQLWSMFRGRRTNFQFLNMSWTYAGRDTPVRGGYQPKLGGDSEISYDRKRGQAAPADCHDCGAAWLQGRERVSEGLRI